MSKQNNSKYSWYVVIICSIVGMSSTMAFSQFSMTIVPLSEASGLSESFLLFSDSVKSTVIMVCMLLSGAVYSKLGLKRMFLLITIIAVIPQLLIPYNSSAIFLLLMKVAQGTFGLLFPIFITLIVSWVKESQSGFGTALFNGAFYGGAGVGGIISGYFIEHFGWISSYFSLAIYIIVFSGIWFFTIKENPSYFETPSQSHLKGNSFFKEFIFTKKVWFPVLMFFSSVWIVQALSLDLPIWADDLGYSSGEVGSLMSSLAIGFFISSLVSGKLSDYFSIQSKSALNARVYVLAIGPILSAISLTIILLIDPTNFLLFYACSLIVAFGAAWGLGSFFCIFPLIFNREHLPNATGLVGGIADITLPLAPFVVGVVFGTRGLWTLGWGICIVISLISVIACFLFINSNLKVTSK